MTNWPDIPERLRTILDTWEDIGRYHIGKPDLVFRYSEKQRKTMRHNAEALASHYAMLEIGENDWPEVMQWTYRRMITKALTVGTHPMSMAWGAAEWLREKTTTSGMRYLEGLDGFTPVEESGGSSTTIDATGAER